jgi:hypothetical protein
VCCWAGTYWVPSATSAGCTACAAGTYGNGNSTSCIPCPAGTFAANAGASACTAWRKNSATSSRRDAWAGAARVRVRSPSAC